MTGLKRSLDESEIECNFKINSEVFANEQDAKVVAEMQSDETDNCPRPCESSENLDHLGNGSELGDHCNTSSMTSQDVLLDVREMGMIASTAVPQYKIVHKKLKIKNPSSVWMIFSNENRDLIYKEFPLMNFTEGALINSLQALYCLFIV